MRQQWLFIIIALTISQDVVLGLEKNEMRRFHRKMKLANKNSGSDVSSNAVPNNNEMAKKKSLSQPSSGPVLMTTSLPSTYSAPSVGPSIRPFSTSSPKSKLKRKNKLKSYKYKLKAKRNSKKHQKGASAFQPSIGPTVSYTPAPVASTQMSEAPSGRPVLARTTRPSIVTTQSPSVTAPKPSFLVTVMPTMKSTSNTLLPVVVSATPTSASSCISLSSNTTTALESVIRQVSGTQTHLCSLAIGFEKELSLDVPVNLTCQGTCVLDGRNASRLFSFGNTLNSSGFSVFFQGFSFVRGRAAKAIGDANPNGGAVVLVGLDDKSFAQFSQCTFSDNHAENSGGAIAFTGFGNLNVTQSLLEGNGANHGGAMYGGVDAVLTTKDSTFLNNVALGGGRAGAAIAVDGVVNCLENNTFYGNVGYPNVLGPSVGCQAAGR